MQPRLCKECGKFPAPVEIYCQVCMEGIGYGEYSKIISYLTSMYEYLKAAHDEMEANTAHFDRLEQQRKKRRERKLNRLLS